MSEALGACQCSLELLQTCEAWSKNTSVDYDCTLPGLEDLPPGLYEGEEASFLSYFTEKSAPNFLVRAAEFEACTGGKIVITDAQNIWEDPVYDLGTKTSTGSELYDGYFMSYSHFPEVSALGLAEVLNERIRKDNKRLQWEDFLPKTRKMGEYRKNGATELDFLVFDGDFFVPIIRMDLFEKYELPIPNTWEEVVEYAKFFNGTDLNDDGDPNDFGFCHFPRLGAGHWDWWWAEMIYSTWATFDQTLGVNQGFFFDESTLKPRIGNGFRRAVEIWKELWRHGSDCESTKFVEGRCAIGFGPPGCWKQVFLNGISRKNSNGTIVWQPKMKSGEYAEPYRLKPFGSTRVVDRQTGSFAQCSPELCPKGEKIPEWGHHGDLHRTNVLPSSPLQGQLINRAPFFWSGGLGTLIRKSAQKVKKDLLWDWLVYANAPATSAHDVANYASWLDSWRYSHLLGESGKNFIEAGWSEQSYEEHKSIMIWALSNTVNSAFNLRLPGLAKYTRDVMGTKTQYYIAGKISVDQLAERVFAGWEEVHAQEGKLNQLEIYRASLGLDELPESDLCRVHRDLMDSRNPATCRKYDGHANLWVVICSGLAVGLIVLVAAGTVFVAERKRRSADAVWKIHSQELLFGNPPEILGRGTFGLVAAASYRGTRVAVKQVIPPKRHNRAKKRHPSGTSQQKTSDYFRSSSFNADDTESSQPCDSAHPSVPYKTALHSKLKSDFIDEMRHLAKLRHPCVTTGRFVVFVLFALTHQTTVMGAVIGAGEEPMLVMECMEHGSLSDLLLNDSMPLNGDLLLPILGDITKGMRFLHAATPEVIHGDLKGANILVDSRFRAKVADFGLSAKKRMGITGTPYWQAPELLLRKVSNNKYTDVYAFGVVISEVFSRKEPYHELDMVDPKRVLSDVADSSVNLRPSLPRGCSKDVVFMMGECVAFEDLKRPTFEEIDSRIGRLDKETIKIGEESLYRQQKKAARNEELLRLVFPKHVADALRDGLQIEPDRADNATVFFSDICGFTNISAMLPAEQVCDMLERLYLKFDELTIKHGVFKLETIGDAYMCASGLLEPLDDHVKRIAMFSIDAMKAANETPILPDLSMGNVKMRIGFHSGPLVAKVCGSRNPKYVVIGDTVNTASRMESNSLEGRIQCSMYSAKLLETQFPELPLEPRGFISIKGKGEMETVFLKPNNDM